MSKPFDVENIDEWLEWLEKLEKDEVEKFKSRVLRSIGLRILEYTHDGTPRRTGRLENSFNFGDKNNVFELKVGKTSYVVVGTTVKYAKHVEEGFKQQAGRFVPGYWQNGTFHYRPNHDEGMVLTGKVIAGAHMMENAVDQVKGDDIDDIVEFEFKRLYAELFD